MGARRRVLWLVKGLGPGGAERLLVSFASASAADDLEYDCAYVRADRSHLVPELATAGVTVHSLRRRSWPTQLRRLIAERGYDVVHMHSPMVAAIARLVVRTFPSGRRPRVVSTEHNVPEAYHPITRLANHLTYGLDDAHLAVSREAVRSAPRRHRGDVEVVIHGVPLASLRSSADRARVRQELGLEPEAVVVGTIANYRVHKAWPDLLEAVSRVLAASPEARFVGIGQGPLRAEVEAAHRRLGLGDRALLLGHRPDAARVLSACDVFVLASIQEGLPVALMEALALGIPVVATAVGGVPEAVTDGVDGRLVPPGQPDRLAAAITELVVDTELRQRLAAGARQRGDAFDIAPAVARTEAIYRRLAGTT